jgi:hypothetical protein
LVRAADATEAEMLASAFAESQRALMSAGAPHPRHQAEIIGHSWLIARD